MPLRCVVADRDGVLSIWLQVCPSLAESQQNEKQAISTMFEREFKQEKNLEARSVANPPRFEDPAKLLSFCAIVWKWCSRVWGVLWVQGEGPAACQGGRGRGQEQGRVGPQGREGRQDGGAAPKGTATHTPLTCPWPMCRLPLVPPCGC